MTSRLSFIALLALSSSLTACKQRSQTITSFGVIRSATPTMKAYLAAARRALEHYLHEQGWASGPWRPSQSEALAAASADHVATWYKNRTEDVPIYVQVHYGGKRQYSLGARVYWHGKGTKAKLDTLQAKASAVQKQLTSWWKAYQAKNPEPR